MWIVVYHLINMKLFMRNDKQVKFAELVSEEVWKTLMIVLGK